MPVLTEELATLCSDPSGGRGHRWQVSCLDFHPNGSMLASGSWDKEVRIWELSNLETKYTLSGVHKTPITALSWQKSSGKLLAVGSSDCTASLWDSNNGKHVGSLTGHSGWVLGVSFLADESYLATGSWDGSIKIWDVETNSLSCTLQGHDKGVWSIDYKDTKGSTLLCSGSEDGTVKIWDTRDRRAIQTMDGGHSLPVYAVNWSSDGAMIASGSEDTKICIWEPTSGSLINTIRGAHAGTVKGLHFNPQTLNMSLPVLASVGGYNMNLSDPRPGKKTDIISLSLHDIGKEVETVVISPDGSLIVTGGRDGNIVLMTLMVPRVLPSFAGQGRINDYKKRQSKAKRSSFIKDITNRVSDEEEEEEEEIDQLDDILSSPLQQEVVANVSRLKRIGRVATKEVELQDHSTVRKNVTAKSSRKRRITGKDVEVPSMVAHLMSRNSRYMEQEEEKREEREEREEGNISVGSSSEEEEEILPIPTPPPSIMIDRTVPGPLSDTGSESEGFKFTTKDLTIFDDTSEGTEDLESQFLEGNIPHSSTHNSLQYSSMDGNYSMMDHLDSSILLTKQKKKVPRLQQPIEGIPEAISMSALSLATGSVMDDDGIIEQFSFDEEEEEEEGEGEEGEGEGEGEEESNDDKESLTVI